MPLAHPYHPGSGTALTGSHEVASSEPWYRRGDDPFRYHGHMHVKSIEFGYRSRRTVISVAGFVVHLGCEEDWARVGRLRTESLCRELDRLAHFRYDLRPQAGVIDNDVGGHGHLMAALCPVHRRGGPYTEARRGRIHGDRLSESLR